MKSLKIVTLVLFLACVVLFTKDNIVARAEEAVWQQTSSETKVKAAEIATEFSILQRGDLIQFHEVTLLVREVSDGCVLVCDRLGDPIDSICDLQVAARDLPTIIRTTDGVAYNQALSMFVKQ